MNESDRLIATLKKLLKRQGYTYRQIGESLNLSEQSVKRLFSTGTFSLERLVQLSGLLKLSLAEVMAQANDMTANIHTLTDTQEKELTADPELLLMAVCVLNNWTPAEITSAYKFSKAECLKKLLKLDHIGLISLMPGDRVRLKVARDFEWLQDGPIQLFFRRQEKNDFLASRFKAEGEEQIFLHGMLTKAANARLHIQLKKLREEFADLHRESLAAPFTQRHGVALLMALREWEPRSFAAMRRTAR